MIYSEEIDFYKRKNRELEQQINSHIKMNKDLKNILETVIDNKENAIRDFYRH